MTKKVEPAEDQKTCKNCKYWNFQKEEGVGECRRNPPATFFDQEEGAAFALWPYTDDTDWCGEFSRKLQA